MSNLRSFKLLPARGLSGTPRANEFARATRWLCVAVVLGACTALSARGAEPSPDNSRAPRDDADLRRWLENMVWHHGFTRDEIREASGLPGSRIDAALKRFKIRRDNRPQRSTDAPLKVLPYPGGRHPRIGFLDGAIRPQRETKISVFAPWNEESYVVLDIPEAIRRNDERTHGLLYLAHTHVPTMWTKRKIELEKLEWQRRDGGVLEMTRRLPNGVEFGTRVHPGKDGVRMQMWLKNGSKETLSNLRVQNCAMLKGAPEFAAQSADHHRYIKPYAACRAAEVDRWVITAWEPCQRTWSNPPCPCLHSDPQFPDCPPGETRRLRGWFSFYEGKNLEAELRRIDRLGWRKD